MNSAENMEECGKEKNKLLSVNVFSCVILLVAIIMVFFVIFECVKTEKNTKISAQKENELIDVNDIAELQIDDIIYNGVCAIDESGNLMHDDKNNAAQYIYYSGRIEIRCDLSAVSIEKDNTENKYIVTIPKPLLNPVVTGIEEIGNYSEDEANALCIEDLQYCVTIENMELIKQAERDLKNTIDSYLSLLIDKRYSVEYQIAEAE